MDTERRSWVEEVTGAEVVSWSRPASGGSRSTYLVDVAGAAPPSRLVLRVDDDGSFTGTEITLAREATAYRALEPTAVPVPHVVAVAPDGLAVLMERLEGTDDLSRLDDAERRSALDHFVDIIVELHAIDVASLDLPGFERPATPEDHACLDLAGGPDSRQRWRTSTRSSSTPARTCTRTRRSWSGALRSCKATPAPATSSCARDG